MVEVVQLAPNKEHECIVCRAKLSYYYIDVAEQQHPVCETAYYIWCPECLQKNSVEKW